MTNPERMNVSKGPEALIGVQFHEDHWNFLFALIIVLQNSEHGLLYIIHYDIEIYLIFFVALGVEGMPQLNDVRVLEFFHYLQFSIFVSFVLVNFLDGDLLVSFVDNCLVDDTKGAIADNSLSIVCVARCFLIFFLLHPYYLIVSLTSVKWF